MPPSRPIDPAARRAPRDARFLLHCHDSYGLGHLRRTLTLAAALRERFEGSRVLVTSGSPCATHFPLPAGVDVVKLPAVTKTANGKYAPRTLGGKLGQVVAMRSQILLAALRTFEPDAVVVDHQVLGLEGELAPLLEEARRRGVRAVLGIRDIIDSPERVAAEWGRPEIRRALSTQYDRICVYGAPEVFDPRLEYPIPPELRNLVEFTGYVVRPRSKAPARAVPHLQRRVLVLVGGGEDGAPRVSTYLDMLERARPGWDSTIVLGPLLPERDTRRIKRRARLIDGVEIHAFHSDVPRLLLQSDAVVSMAGYNSVAEILQSRTPAVLWPRTAPRREQLLRAERLEALGLVSSLPAPTPESLRARLEEALARGRTSGPLPPLDGHARLCSVVGGLLRHETPKRKNVVA